MTEAALAINTRSNLISLPYFNSISVVGDITCIVSFGERRSCRVETDGHGHLAVDAQVLDKDLVVKGSEECTSSNTTVYLEVDDLTRLRVIGQGVIDANAKAGSLKLDVQGSGCINVSGNCASCKITLEGNGEINASNLLPISSIAYLLRGNGQITANALNISNIQNIKGILEGNGRVNIANGEATKHINRGPGNLVNNASLKGVTDDFLIQDQSQDSVDLASQRVLKLFNNSNPTNNQLLESKEPSVDSEVANTKSGRSLIWFILPFLILSISGALAYFYLAGRFALPF